MALSGTDPDDYAESDNCAASSPIAAQGKGTCTIDVTFTPQAVGARLATLVVTDNSGDKNATQHQVSLTGVAVQAATNTTVTPSTNPSVFGQSVTFTATVTPDSPVAPTGTVTFKNGTTTICNAVALTSDEATCAISTLAAGTHSITAVYSGDTNFVGSTSAAVSQTVSLPVLTITASSGSFTYGGTVPAITPVYSGFVNGDTAASVTTPPICSTTATSLSPVGSSPYPSSCAGAVDGNYTIQYVKGSVTESAATTSTAITSIAPNPSFVGQPVTVSYKVTVNPPGGGTLPGTDKVTVTDSTGASCTGTVASGDCALTPTAVGPDTLTATYGGDIDFQHQQDIGHGGVRHRANDKLDRDGLHNLSNAGDQRRRGAHAPALTR